MDWKQVVKYALAAVSVIAVGGLVYDAISSRVSLDRADRLISGLRTDNQRIRDRLNDAQDRVVDLETTVGSLREGNRVLEEELERSAAIVQSLRDENIRVRDELGRIRGELNRSRATVDALREENQRLGDAIRSGLDSTDTLTDAHQSLGDSLDRALRILDGYADGVGW